MCKPVADPKPPRSDLRSSAGPFVLERALPATTIRDICALSGGQSGQHLWTTSQQERQIPAPAAEPVVVSRRRCRPCRLSWSWTQDACTRRRRSEEIFPRKPGPMKRDGTLLVNRCVPAYEGRRSPWPCMPVNSVMKDLADQLVRDWGCKATINGLILFCKP